MARAPGVQTLDPVSKPMESPAQAGRPGEAIAGLGESINDDTLQEQSLNLFKKRAQQSVDEIAAQNQAHAAVLQYEDQLAKTPNSRDIPGVKKQAQDTLNGIAKHWSNSPASVSIQQQLDGLKPQVEHLGDMRDISLMGKELKINLDYQADTLAGDYASGNRDGALAAFTSAVDSPGGKLLLGDAERGEYIRQFKIQGQELEIKNGITNANPEVNTQIYDAITQNRDRFPDVTQEKLDTYKGQALAAFEAHTKQQDWAEGQMALKTQLVPKINQFTNPATGSFDEAGAMADNADRMAKGEITEAQSKVLAEGFASHQAQLEFGLKQEANKRLDGIEKKLSAHDFAGASADLEANQPWFENNGFGNDYRAALRYTAQKRTEVRVEASAARTAARQDYLLARQIEQEQSADTLAQVQHFIVGGGMLTKSDLYNMAGTGKGKMRTQDVDAAWKIMQSYEKEPDFAAAMKQLDQSFPITKTATADQAAAQNRKYAETVEVFQQQVNAHPDQSKQEIMNNLLKSQATETIKDHANAMFGTTPSTPIKDFFTHLFNYGANPGDPGYKAPAAEPKTAPIVQHSPSTGKDRYSTDGGKTWQPGKPPQ